MSYDARHQKPLIAYTFTTLIGVSMVSNIDQASAAFTGSNTQDINFQASVAGNCRLSNPITLAFGSYDPVEINETAPLDADGSFNIRCNKGGSGDISINNGQNYSAPNRRMKRTGSSDFLNYQIYTTAARTTVWDNVNIVVYGPAASTAQVTRAVNGRIPGGQSNAVAGNYTDIVIITVSY